MEQQQNERITTMTVRLSERDLMRIKRVCHRDEIKPALFAYKSIIDGLERLIAEQEVRGYQCNQPL